MSRKSAIVRLWAFLWANTFGYVLGFIIGILALVWGVVDIVVTLITGRDYLKASSTPAGWISATIGWLADQTIFAFTGDGQFQWAPSP